MAHAFRFTTTLSSWQHQFMKTAVVVPESVVEQLPSKGRIRVEGVMNGAPFALAIQRVKSGERFLSVSASLRKAANIEIGDEVRVAFSNVDPDALAIPEELQALLDVDDDARTAWETLTRGIQRGLVHYVSSVKSSDARIRRSLEIMRKAQNRELSVQKKK
ncbi:MAG: YdeI/OmpD-associated family protein [Candidatus Kapabacteria bacterium]|nr:YdeI/OmpD-associated family protein [Candidatus Kapabacteria bacterium]